jgi:hypothetical protein
MHKAFVLVAAIAVPFRVNILTAPTDNWTLPLRVYFPSESVQNNKYKLPEP